MRFATRFLTALILVYAATTAAASAATTLCVKPVPSGTGCWATAYTEPADRPGRRRLGRRDLGRGRHLQADRDGRPDDQLRDEERRRRLRRLRRHRDACAAQRDPAVNVTILSGDIGTPGVSNDNSYHVVTAGATVTLSGVLDGFTITAARPTARRRASNDRGAGLWVNGGSPTLVG